MTSLGNSIHKRSGEEVCMCLRPNGKACSKRWVGGETEMKKRPEEGEETMTVSVTDSCQE